MTQTAASEQNAGVQLASLATWALTALTGCLMWRSIWQHGHTHPAQGPASHDKEFTRRQAGNHSFMRATCLTGGTIYVAALTYVQASARPGQMQPSQAIGLILAYCVVAFVLWSMMTAMIPILGPWIRQYKHTVAVVIFASFMLFCNFAPSMGVMHGPAGLAQALCYNLFWLLEDEPLGSYVHSMAGMSALHTLSRLSLDQTLYGKPFAQAGIAIMYCILGIITPIACQAILQHTARPSLLPGSIYRAICTTACFMTVTDMLLRTSHLSEQLHTSAQAGNSFARLVVSLQSSPASGQSISYGWAPEVYIGVLASLIFAVLASCAVTACCMPEPATNDAKTGTNGTTQHATPTTVSTKAKLLTLLPQNPVMQHVLDWLRSLDTYKQAALCMVVSMGCVQGVAISGLVFSLTMTDAQLAVQRTPMTLVHVLVALAVQVAGLMYVLSGQSSSTSKSLNNQEQPNLSVGASLSQQERSLGAQNSLMFTTQNALPSIASIPDSLDSLGNSQPLPRVTPNTPNTVHGAAAGSELASRLEALTHYQAFMQGLDEQPQSYSVEEFIRGSANALKGIFPQVHHASFCLLNQTRTAVNMHTFLGEGSQKPPRTNVSVARSTMLYHVLHNCQPVFVPNISQFPGSFSDVQFMRFVLGVRSVACLPLVSASGGVLGVLRLGFNVPYAWTEAEQSIAMQVALILSSSSNVDSGLVGELHLSGQEGLGNKVQGSSASHGPHGLQDVIGSGQHSANQMSMLSQPQHHSMMQLQNRRSKTTHNDSAHNNSWAAGGRVSAGNMMVYDPVNGITAMSGASGHLGPTSQSRTAIGPTYIGSTGQFVSSFAAGSRAAMPSPVGHSLGPWQSSDMLHSRKSSVAITGGIASSGTAPRSSGIWPAMPEHALSLGAATSLGSSGQAGLMYRKSLGNGQHHNGVAPLSKSTSQQLPAHIQGPLSPPGVSPWHQSPPGILQMPMSASNGTSAGVSGAFGESSVGSLQSGSGGSTAQNNHNNNADMQLLQVIGRGGFGSVYKARWKGKLVAVKILEHGDEFLGCTEANINAASRKLDLNSRRAALLEGAMTSTINHPNVVATYDYRVVQTDTQGLGNTRISQETHIVMEWCDKGSLQDAMEHEVFSEGKQKSGKEDESKQVDLELICMTLAEVSAAMEYLHTHRITHRDLKPKNVLLKSAAKDRRGFVAKVSDFGLSQVLLDTQRTQVSKNYSGTVTHMPPELIEDGKVYPQGDVYAFGIMMWEVFTGQAPYTHMAHPQIMVAVVTHNLRPRFPENCPDWYKSLAYKCWQKEPKNRPSFREITSQLMSHITDRNWQAVVAQDA